MSPSFLVPFLWNELEEMGSGMASTPSAVPMATGVEKAPSEARRPSSSTGTGPNQRGELLGEEARAATQPAGQALQGPDVGGPQLAVALPQGPPGGGLPLGRAWQRDSRLPARGDVHPRGDGAVAEIVDQVVGKLVQLATQQEQRVPGLMATTARRGTSRAEAQDGVVAGVCVLRREAGGRDRLLRLVALEPGQDARHGPVGNARCGMSLREAVHDREATAGARPGKAAAEHFVPGTQVAAEILEEAKSAGNVLGPPRGATGDAEEAHGLAHQDSGLSSHHALHQGLEVVVADHGHMAPVVHGTLTLDGRKRVRLPVGAIGVRPQDGHELLMLRCSRIGCRIQERCLACNLRSGGLPGRWGGLSRPRGMRQGGGTAGKKEGTRPPGWPFFAPGGRLSHRHDALCVAHSPALGSLFRVLDVAGRRGIEGWRTFLDAPGRAGEQSHHSPPADGSCLPGAVLPSFGRRHPGRALRSRSSRHVLERGWPWLPPAWSSRWLHGTGWGRNWSGRIEIKRTHELVRSGPYRVTRHPIYTGILLGLLGSAVALGELRGLVAVALALGGLPAQVERRGTHAGARSSARSTRPTAVEVKALIPLVL